MPTVAEQQTWPGHVPQPPRKFVLEVTLDTDLETPGGVAEAIARSIRQYGADNKGTVTPFDQQPGFPAGYIYSPKTGRKVGEWRVTS